MTQAPGAAPPSGEMPFLDHLEELRSRILRSLGAVVLAFGAGLWLVEHFQLVSVMKEPIAPYLNGGRLTVLSPTEPLKIVLRLAFSLGLVLASPVVLWQVWAFVAPGLYAREKRALVPALFVGAALFLTGAVLAYLYVLPQALRVLFSFQTEAIAPMVTYDAYFDFVLQIVLAFGLSFELPLVIIILAVLGVVTPMMLHRFRRFAVVGAFVAGAVLSPGADILSMIMMTIPLIVLYEVGFLGASLVHRRRLRRSAAEALVVIGLLLAGVPGTARAQEPVRPRDAPADSARADSARADSARARGDTTTAADTGLGRPPGGPQALDTARARRLGIPTAPSRDFAPADSTLERLLARPGYETTRFSADSATLMAAEDRIVLTGDALTRRQGITLEADTITYSEPECEVSATGAPKLFEERQVVVGEGIRYDTCDRRGVITGALTNFEEGSTVWFLRGNVAHDSSASRIFAGSSEITSCDLPVPHYHFAAKRVKWVSKTMLVARPVVLYIRDVPVLWLPFLFQDTRPGRRSGILIPQFGINDIVRTSADYRRQVTNIGYYWAASDYLDATFRLDWYSGRFLDYGVTTNYRWLDRFVEGSFGVTRKDESGPGSSLNLTWSHQQRFSLRSSLNFNIEYATNLGVVSRNAINPSLNIQQLNSSASYRRSFGWGELTIGGNRRQSLSDSLLSQQLPSVTVVPKPIDFGRSITWTPNLRFTNDETRNGPASVLLLARTDGTLDSIPQVRNGRISAFAFDTPLRIGGFNWANTLQLVDSSSTVQQQVSFREPNPATPDPNDSVEVFRTTPGSFGSGLDWETGINLPILFRGSWKLQPQVGVTNIVQGQPFAVRGPATNGGWVTQGKRFALSATASPTFFGFLNAGIGPFQRFRHSVSPLLRWEFAPAADVPEGFARAVTPPGLTLPPRSEAVQRVSFGLSQNLEGKFRPPRSRRDSLSDTTGVPMAMGETDARKVRLLSLSTSAVQYDFEQAKLPGRSGWVTPSVTNNLLSDLLPGFNLTLTHDLWRGTVGSDTADFDPFLTQVSANFSLGANTFRSIGSVLGLGGRRAVGEGVAPAAPSPTMDDPSGRLRTGTGFFNTDQTPLGNGRRGFQATVRYSLTRTRPIEGQTTLLPDRQSVNLGTSFSPTPLWALGWNTQYNITDKKFESHELRLERDLHEWRASFNFTRAPNGNVGFYFSVFLTDLPDLKFEFNDTDFDR